MNEDAGVNPSSEDEGHIVEDLTIRFPCKAKQASVGMKAVAVLTLIKTLDLPLEAFTAFAKHFPKKYFDMLEDLTAQGGRVHCEADGSVSMSSEVPELSNEQLEDLFKRLAEEKEPLDD